MDTLAEFSVYRPGRSYINVDAITRNSNTNVLRNRQMNVMHATQDDDYDIKDDNYENESSE